jgi:sec-independent protein translocase protein TatA
MPNLGAPELIIILVIALLILGPGKLPEVGASLGKTIREFRKASADVQEAVKVDTSVAPVAAPAPVAAAAPVAPVAPAEAAPAVTPTAADPTTIAK